MTDIATLTRVRRLAANGTAETIRRSAGLSLGDVAAAAAVARSTVLRWERGDRKPTGDAAARYLAVLDEVLETSR